jgi:YVTN family beta-propeller protein
MGMQTWRLAGIATAFVALTSAAVTTAPAADGAASANAARHRPVILYVADSGAGTITPINTATNTAGRPITVGAGPVQLVATPNGRTIYVVNTGSGTVSPVSTNTDKAGPPITVGAGASAIAVTPNGNTVLVTVSNGVVPISTATDTAGPLIKTGPFPRRSSSRRTARPPTCSTMTSAAIRAT